MKKTNEGERVRERAEILHTVGSSQEMGRGKHERKKEKE